MLSDVLDVFDPSSDTLGWHVLSLSWHDHAVYVPCVCTALLCNAYVVFICSTPAAAVYVHSPLQQTHLRSFAVCIICSIIQLKHFADPNNCFCWLQLNVECCAGECKSLSRDKQLLTN